MKRRLIYMAAAALLCAPLFACGSGHATRSMRRSHVAVPGGDAIGGGRVGDIRLGAGDGAGNMLHTYYLANFRDETQPAEEIVFHGPPPPVDPAP